MTEPNSSRPDNWERQTMEKLLFSVLKEQRKARNWGIFFKLLFFVWVFLAIGLGAGWFGPRDSEQIGPHTAVVDLQGVIMSDSDARADKIIQGLHSALKDANTRGVIIRANSPGGSPVQSAYMYDEIRRLRQQYPKIPIYTVVEDMCASGCYYAAAASDKIYVSPSSLVGSIGVLMNGFGFTGTLEKLGIERRLVTAGENKGFLDPFSPVSPKQLDYAKAMLADIHQQFITAVKTGRGVRLKSDPDLFSGLVWNGSRGVDLGLADGYGSVDSVARDVIKAEKVVDFTPKEDLAERFAKRFGASAMQSLWNGASTQLH